MQIGEYLLLAKLVVSGSVEDERIFSAFGFVTITRRNALKVDHVEWFARVRVQNMFILGNFPFENA